MNALDRREFLRTCIAAGCAVPVALGVEGRDASAADAGDDEPKVKYGGVFYEKEARFWRAGERGAVTCGLCPKGCAVADGERGHCGVRENRKGKYFTLVWGNPCAIGVDPIEKKPFYHVLPGEKAFSIATAGCNMRCKFCQNWNISQAKPEQTRNIELPPDAVVKMAKKNECTAVAFTYTEPTVFTEYVLDTAKAAKDAGLRPITISNGYICEEPMKELCKVLTAVKIDLKAFTEKFYTDITDAELKPVLQTLQLLKKEGMWFEVVHLIVPTLNDKADDLKALSKWVKKELGADVPLHFSAFHPMYKLSNLVRTADKTMFDAYDIARAEGLNYVYVGNVTPAGHKAEHTYCPKCGKVVIERRAYVIKAKNLKDGKCAGCGQAIPGVWT